MKKFLIVFAAILVAVFFVGCKDPINETPKAPANNTPTSTTQTSGTPATGGNGTSTSATDKPETTPADTPSETPSTDTPETDATATLPENVGEDPFKGNTYQDNYNKYVFGNDGILEDYGSNDNGITFEYEPGWVFTYTYNANTKILAMKIDKLSSAMFTGDSSNNTSWTWDEIVSYISSLTDVQVAQMFDGMSKSEFIEMGRKEFSWIEYLKAEEEMHDGKLCLSMRDYYLENTELTETHEIHFTNTAETILMKTEPADEDGFYGYISNMSGSVLKQTYGFTKITDSTITAKGENDNVIITLNYTRTWADGVIYITVSGADDAGKAALGNQSYRLSTSTDKDYYPKVTAGGENPTDGETSGSGNETGSGETTNDDSGTSPTGDSGTSTTDETGSSTTGNTSTASTTTELPPNVGTDPFKGNTYGIRSEKYVFGTDGTITKYYFEDYDDNDDTNDEYIPNQICNYTYDANTHILYIKVYKMQGPDGTLMTHDEMLDYYNGLTDEQINAMNESVTLTKANMIEYINAGFNTIVCGKAEEEICQAGEHQGELCLSTTDYYSENTSLAASELKVDFSTTGLYIRIYPSAEVPIIGAYGYIGFGDRHSGMVPHYKITAITESTITATSEDGNSTITFNYTTDWDDGVIYITVSGADDAGKAALGNQSYELLSEINDTEYYPKITAGGNGASQLPPNVGTDPFKGNTYQTSSDKYVFSTNGTIEVWDYRSDQWKLESEFEYTYNANTKVLSYKCKKIPGEGGSGAWTLSDALEWVNELSDNDVQSMGMTRAQMRDTLNAMFNTVRYYKAEEVIHEGNLCLSIRDYYPDNTTLRIRSFYIQDGRPSIDISIIRGTVEMPIYIFGSFSTNGSETNYTMTNLTNSTITATSEDGNSTITLNYTISWYDGMYTLIITGADDASQAAIGDEPLTFTSNTQYFAKQ